MKILLWSCITWDRVKGCMQITFSSKKCRVVSDFHCSQGYFYSSRSLGLILITSSIYYILFICFFNTPWVLFSQFLRHGIQFLKNLCLNCLCQLVSYPAQTWHPKSIEIKSSLVKSNFNICSTAIWNKQKVKKQVTGENLGSTWSWDLPSFESHFTITKQVFI